MNSKDFSNKEFSELQDEDIRQIRKTIKRVPNNKTEKTKVSDNRIIILLSVLIVAVLFLAGIMWFIVSINKTDVLNGTWSYDDVTVYVFDGHGHGTLQLPLNSYEYSYTVQDGTVQLDFADESIEDRIYTYTLSDDVLFLIGDDGTSYRFAKAG